MVTPLRFLIVIAGSAALGGVSLTFLPGVSDFK